MEGTGMQIDSAALRKVTIGLISVVVLLALVSLIVQVIHFQVGQDYPLRATIETVTNVASEDSIPSWFSSSQLLLSSVLLAVITLTGKHAEVRERRYWQFLAVIFLFLSMEEAVGFHERISRVLREALHTGGFLHYPWILIGALLTLVFAAEYWRFWTRLPLDVRRLVFAAGAIYVMGAIGVEAPEGFWVDMFGQDNLPYALMTTVEELLEMLGIAIFISALLRYIVVHLKLAFCWIPC
jgi:hypothetical protein